MVVLQFGLVPDPFALPGFDEDINNRSRVPRRFASISGAVLRLAAVA